MNEYVIVKFPERRVVLVDGTDQGYNKKEDGEDLVKEMETGLYTFKLDGEANFSPPEQDIEVIDTDPVSPMEVVFTKGDVNV